MRMYPCVWNATARPSLHVSSTETGGASGGELASMAGASSGASSSKAHACAVWDIPDKQKIAATAGVTFEAWDIDVRGFLHVGRHQGNTFLTNTLTLEQQLLVAPDSLLELDTFADGEDAALVRVFGDDDREVRDVGGVLRHEPVRPRSTP